jgi:hypothetical protein
MKNFSIPNSTPATGRTSTQSSTRLRSSNNRAAFPFSVIRRSILDACSGFVAKFSASAVRSWVRWSAKRRIRRGELDATFEQSTANDERREQNPRSHEHWMFAFSFAGRVKGAWWPSRSSKPPLPRKRRGRFDSYPLRIPTLVVPSQSRRRGRSRWISWRYLKGRSSGFLDLARNEQNQEEVETCHVSKFAN